jgi:hypothetical protein
MARDCVSQPRSGQGDHLLSVVSTLDWLACGGAGDSGGFRQRRRVGVADSLLQRRVRDKSACNLQAIRDPLAAVIRFRRSFQSDAEPTHPRLQLMFVVMPYSGCIMQ